jgi:outer membrane protein assembly factor BamD (BamD/ComL family)
MENLRTQFSIAVQDHNWQEAIRVGETIMIDFPNTQMAKEVREKMDALRQRASETTRGAEMARA